MNIGPELRVLKVLDPGGQHDHAATGKISDLGNQSGVHTLGHHLGRCDHRKIGHVIAIVIEPTVDLDGLDEGLHRGCLRGQFTQGLPHRRDGNRAVHLGDSTGKRHEKAQLDHQPHDGLVLLEPVTGGVMELTLTHSGIVDHEHPLPRDLYLIEIE